MSTPPRPLTNRADISERRPSQDLLSSSPHRDATTRLLSSSPSIPPFFARPASRGSNASVHGEGHTPSSSWRSPSTLQNYRADDAGSSTEALHSSASGQRTGVDSSSNSIHGYPGHQDTISSILDIPADEASKVVKKHLVLNSASRDSLDSDRIGSGTGGGPSSTSGHHDGGASEVVDYTTAFKLPGGAITRDVYKWQADQENEQNRRGK
ncbi:hypothetical protein BGX28_007457 [Mortierella sp. GBA30]|nr:hypothetical protein BGX28_007457 [Mortierella sp. GBA30]